MECALFCTEQLICHMSLCHCAQFGSTHVQIKVQKILCSKTCLELNSARRQRPFCAHKYTNRCIKIIEIIIAYSMVISFELMSFKFQLSFSCLR